MRYLLIFLLPFLLFAKPFKVASYNVENLFDATIQGTEYEDYTPKHNWTARMAEVKLDHAAEVICDLDADIVGLQEVENEAILSRLQERLEAVGCDYPYRAITRKNGAPIQVGMLSRFPVVRTKELTIFPSQYVRNILEAEVKIGGERLTLFINHWKSKSRQGWESKRIASARVLNARLDALPQGANYIVLGDFNTDVDGHYTLEKRLNDTLGKTGLHHTLGVVSDEDGVVWGRHALYSLWGELSSQDRWNTKFYGKRGTHDHLLLPPSMFDGKGVDYLNDTFGVFKRAYLFTKQGYINRWEYKNKRHTGSGYSDHLPIFALFDTAPYKKGVSKTPKREMRRIEYLYEKESLDAEVVLENATVVWKRGLNALIKQSVEGRGIFLYGCAEKLQAGKRYDLLIAGIQSYHGLKEITHAYVLAEKGDANTEAFMLEQEDFASNTRIRQNESVRNVWGIYRNKKLHIGNKIVPIYFKRGTKPPPNGAKLKISYALLGYYNTLQLVVQSPDDFTILE